MELKNNEKCIRSGKILGALLLHYWKTMVLILAPVLASPLLFYVNTQEAKCGWVGVIMASYWAFEVVPLPVTALMPVFLFPLTGIMATKEVTKVYMKETVMMFLGSLMMALAIEHSNLHKRLGLRMLSLMGVRKKWLLLGSMLNTMFVSMWISNTAAVALMLPLMEAILENFETERAVWELAGRGSFPEDSVVGVPLPPSGGSERYLQSEPDPPLRKGGSKDFRKVLMLGTVFAANIGGTSTLAGTSVNLVLKGVIDTYYKDCRDLNFASWMMVTVPGMLICVFLTWVVLLLLFQDCTLRSCGSDHENEKIEERIRLSLQNMGSMSRHEISVSVLFFLLVTLWFFRDPGFVKGWAPLFKAGVDDATPAIFIIFLMFILPVDPQAPWRNWKVVYHGGRKAITSSPVLHNWNIIHEKLPWGTCILIGGGFALSEGTVRSGLSEWIGRQTAFLQIGSPSALILIVTVVISFLTEVTSNATTATILLPILAKMASELHVNPLLVLVPATLSCSYSFILPTGNPSNSLAFEAGNMEVSDMAKSGFIVKIICLVVANICMQTLGVYVLHANTFPTWAMDNSTATPPS